MICWLFYYWPHPKANDVFISIHLSPLSCKIHFVVGPKQLQLELRSCGSVRLESELVSSFAFIDYYKQISIPLRPRSRALKPGLIRFFFFWPCSIGWIWRNLWEREQWFSSVNSEFRLVFAPAKRRLTVGIVLLFFIAGKNISLPLTLKHSY